METGPVQPFDNFCRRACLALLISTLATPALAAWRTTEFQVFVGRPHLDPNSEGLDVPDPASLVGGGPPVSVIVELESYLHDVAVAFEGDGFPDPLAAGSLGPLVETVDGRQAIRVYLFDMTEDIGMDDLGFRSGKCDTPPSLPRLMMNSRYMYRGDTVTAGGYQNAAHELFHAVQYATNFKRVPAPCKQGSWITEGTADAVGFDYARRLRNISTHDWNKLAGGSFMKAWGARAWYLPLPYKIPVNTAGRKLESWDYHSSSFWRDLAELTHARRNGGSHPQSRLAPVDYRYLVSLFSNRPPGLGYHNELAWLDDWMKTYPHIMRDLGQVYAQFMGSAADHMWRRIPAIRDLPGNEREHRWLDYLFEPCAEVTLSPDAPQKDADFELDLVASRCFRVRLEGDDAASELVIQANNFSADEQKQLWIAAIGGKIVGQADQRVGEPGKPDAGKSYAWWRLPVAPGKENIFIIANAARTARETQPLSGPLNFSIPRWTSSKAQDQAADGDAQGQPKTSEDVARKQRAMRAKPSRNTATSVMVGRGSELPDPGCDASRRGRNLCGPQLQIALSLDHGGIPDPALLGGAGGLLAQSGGVMEGMAAGPAEDLLAQLQAQQAAATGDLVSISIPLIPIGSGGAFDNAFITVNRGGGPTERGSLDSLNPAPDDDGLHAPNGNVTITEYTPDMIRGEFSADLVDQNQRHGPNQSLFRVVDSISGSFNIPAPWRGNARPDVGADSPMMQGIKSDVVDLLQQVPPDMRRSLIGGPQVRQLCRLLTTQELENLGIPGACEGGAAAAFVPGAVCDCDCERWEYTQSLPRCGEICDAKWESWSCGPYLQTGLGELDAETERYQAEVQQLGVPENVWKPWVAAFRASSPGIRAGLWEELEAHRGEAPPTADIDEQLQAIEAENAERRARLDAADSETQRYRDALERAGYTQAEIDGMVEVFNISPEAVRQAFWADVNARLPPEDP